MRSTFRAAALLLCLNCSALSSFALSDTTELGRKGAFQIIVYDFEAAAEDFVYFAGEFVSPSLSSLAMTGGIVGGAALVGALGDEEIRHIALRNQSATGERIFSVFNSFGELEPPAILTGGLYVGGLIAGNEKIRTTGRLVGESLLLAGIITTLGKSVVGRSRPFRNEGAGTFSPFSIDDSRLSFPSGHSTVVFAMAAALSISIDLWYVSAALYSAAALTGIARMYYDRHWLSDVCMGAAIGIFSANMAHNAENRRHEQQKNSALRFALTPNGLAFRCQW